jgi:hypothetical protein
VYQAEAEAAERAHLELLARLPAGWAEYLDDQGVAYYVNEQTEETCWEAPQLALEVEDEAIEEEESGAIQLVDLVHHQELYLLWLYLLWLYLPWLYLPWPHLPWPTSPTARSSST